MEEDLLMPEALDSQGYPVNPPAEGFQDLGQVYGTSTSNAFLAEQEANRVLNMNTRERIAMANQRAKSEEMAMRLAGQMEYEQLVSGGAKPEEALRRVAHKLYFNSPTGLASALRATAPREQFNPSVTKIEGGRLIQTGPNRVQYDRDRPLQMPPEVKAQQEVLKNKLRAASSGQGALVADPKEVAELERQYVEGSTNWMGRAEMPKPPATDAAKSPFKEGQVIRNRKDGKLYKVVNGQPVLQE